MSITLCEIAINEFRNRGPMREKLRDNRSARARILVPVVAGPMRFSIGRNAEL